MDFLSRLSGLGAEYSRPTPTQKLWASSDLSAAVQHHLLQASGDCGDRQAAGVGRAEQAASGGGRRRRRAMPQPATLHRARSQPLDRQALRIPTAACGRHRAAAIRRRRPTALADQPPSSSPSPTRFPAQVYVTLAVALGLAASGVYLSALTGYGQGLGMICFMVCVPWLVSTPAQPHNTNKRRALFAGAAVGQGLLLAPLVRTTLALNPGVLAAAFAGTAGAWVLGVGRLLLLRGGWPAVGRAALWHAAVPLLLPLSLAAPVARTAVLTLFDAAAPCRPLPACRRLRLLLGRRPPVPAPLLPLPGRSAGLGHDRSASVCSHCSSCAAPGALGRLAQQAAAAAAAGSMRRSALLRRARA